MVGPTLKYEMGVSATLNNTQCRHMQIYAATHTRITLRHGSTRLGRKSDQNQNITAPGNAAHYNPKNMVWALHSRGTIPGQGRLGEVL